MTSTKCGFDHNGSHGQGLLCSTGPTLLVYIGFDPSWSAATVPITVPNIPTTAIAGLVDTGAGESCIDSALAMALALPIIDRRSISGSAGAHEVNVHLAQIHAPNLNYTVFGSFCAVDLAAGGQMHQALIGRTFLQNFTMVYEGKTGGVTIHDGTP